MQLTGLHLLLTYQCNYECDHCFTWGSPWQHGTMTLNDVRHILQQAVETTTITGIYFEGGEPFLYYPLLVKGVREAVSHRFEVGIVTNGYWAISREDALLWLQPLQGLVGNLSLSCDHYHQSELREQQVQYAVAAAEQLGIPLGFISIAQPQTDTAAGVVGQLPLGESAVMYRGRAVQQLAPDAARHHWELFDHCPHEELQEPGRLHVDAFGNLQICQGITIGNLFQQPLQEICDQFQPESHPIVGPLLAGGPVELVRRYRLPVEAAYADACHLCSVSCRALRDRFPQQLAPDQMFGIMED